MLLMVIVMIICLCKPTTAQRYIGWLGVTIVIIMFSGPLAAIQSIIRDRSTASLPFSFTVASFINCLMWSGYGLAVIDDINVYGPNLAGLLATLVQLSLFCVFPRAHKGKLGADCIFIGSDVDDEEPGNKMV